MTYSIDRLIELIDNPRILPRGIKYPCSICHKSVRNNHKAILCMSCDLWSHASCNSISFSEYEVLQTEEDDTSWNCVLCKLKSCLTNTPFSRCNNEQLIMLNKTNTLKFLESLPSVEILNETSKFFDETLFTNRFEIPSKTSSKYYSVDQFQKLDNSSKLNIFHTNIN